MTLHLPHKIKSDFPHISQNYSKLTKFSDFTMPHIICSDITITHIICSDFIIPHIICVIQLYTSQFTDYL